MSNQAQKKESSRENKMKIAAGFVMPRFAKVAVPVRVTARNEFAAIVGKVIQAHGMGLDTRDAMNHLELVDPLLYKGNFEAAVETLLTASTCLMDAQNACEDGTAAMFCESIIMEIADFLDKAEVDIEFARNYWTKKLAEHEDVLQAIREEVLRDAEKAREIAEHINAENSLRRLVSSVQAARKVA
jgi:hypothetical protein